MFKYKQFTIRDENTAMKVGTDGTLLGCWIQCSEASLILDVGTGTGVIALMCAQKNKKARIVALELDENAIVDAKYNLSSAPLSWSERITLHKGSLQEYYPELPFDHIVSNPPFFERSQKSEDLSRNRARHSSSLHYEDLFDFANRHLSSSGRLSIILPYLNGIEASERAKEHGLYVCRLCEVHPVPEKEPHRILLELGKKESKPERTRLVIETGLKRHDYTEEYKQLGKEFYLYF